MEISLFFLILLILFRIIRIIRYLDGKYVIRFLLSPPSLLNFIYEYRNFFSYILLIFNLKFRFFSNLENVSVEFEYYGIFVRFY